MRGYTATPCIVNLHKGELRIPSYNIRVQLSESLVKALAEENELEPRPDFVSQVS